MDYIVGWLTQEEKCEGVKIGRKSGQRVRKKGMERKGGIEKQQREARQQRGTRSKKGSLSRSVRTVMKMRRILCNNTRTLHKS